MLIATLFVLVFISSAVAARRERLIDSWKPINYNLSIAFNSKLSEISAAAEITVLTLKDNVMEIDLDFGELVVDRVTVDDETTPFERANGRLNVKLSKATARDQRLVITVFYHGVPRDGLILSADKAGKPSAIGDNWPDRLHHWVPSLDHPSAKATVRFKVTAPAHNLVVANGKLDQVENSATTRTWTYTEKVPIPPYCMIIAVGDFSLVNPTLQDVTPLAYYVPSPDRDFAMQGFAPANPSLKFFSQTVAPYPYEKLALIIGATRFGGMENSSAIVFSNNLFDTRLATQPLSKVFNIREDIVSLVAHEIAHQWFGDSVTESTWSDLWLSEGFATYFAALFIQRHEGEEVFQRYMKSEAEAYFNYARNTRTPLHDTETEDLFRLLNANNYQKGAWVLHMLRGMMGDAAFYEGIRSYYAAHANATASSEDLRAALEKSSKLNLKEFFDRWVYSSGHPIYQISWRWGPGRQKGSELTITIRQTQAGEPFLTPIPIEIVTKGGVKHTSVRPTSKETVLTMPLTTRPTAVNLDPQNFVLKEASVVRAVADK